MDPLSDVLSLLKPRSYRSAGFNAGGDWSIQFSAHQGSIKFNAVISGECWLCVDGVSEPVHLRIGDCFLLPSGRPFRLASDLAVVPVAAETVFLPAGAGGVATCNGGGDFYLTGSRFALDGAHARILLEELPPIVHIRRESDQAALRWSLERMMQELREGEPGGFLIAEHLAHMMLVQALRLHLVDASATGAGWLSALGDAQMRAAITAMHDDPARAWTLQALAQYAGMSRSTFALRFKETVATSPMQYLTRWRMLLAADRLTHSAEPVSAIALSLGYESESAFSTAFRRTMGCSPRQYGRTPDLPDHGALPGQLEPPPVREVTAAR